MGDAPMTGKDRLPVASYEEIATPTIGGFPMRKLLAIACSLATLGCWSATTALGARNPAGTGQPGVAQLEKGGAECGAPGSEEMTKGFKTEAFEAATTKYAGSEGTPSAENGSAAHAISEYDVACFQQTQSH
jgi:hypothetical protein